MGSTEVVLLAFATVVIGIGDLLGGIASRRGNPIAVAGWSQLVGIPIVFALALFVGGDPLPRDLLLGAVAGLGSGLGVSVMYRGFAHSAVGIVAPTASTIATVIPIVVALVLGERPSSIVAVGLAMALVAIVLIGRVRDTPINVRSGLLHGLVSGVGFGAMVVTYSMTSTDSGVWAVVSGRMSGPLAIFTVALVVGSGSRLLRSNVLPTGLAGVLTTVGLAAFVVASQTSELIVLGVALAMIPAFTVLLAVIFLKERLAVTQWIGIGVAATAIALISVG
jgi:drug/metabolite transporter (DMT)-like permease